MRRKEREERRTVGVKEREREGERGKRRREREEDAIFKVCLCVFLFQTALTVYPRASLN